MVGGDFGVVYGFGGGEGVEVFEGGEEAAGGAGLEEGVEEVADVGLGDGKAKVIGGDAFDGVTFVEDDAVVVGKDGGTGAAEGEVGEEEGVVADEELAVGDAAAGGLIEAAVEVFAAAAEAVALFGADFIPDLPGGLARECRRVSRRWFFQPSFRSL